MNFQETHQEQSLVIRDEQFGNARRRLRTGSFLWIALLSLVVLLALPSLSFAQSPLTDDAHVSLSQGNANHGTNPNLKVSAAQNTYLKFKLFSTLPAATPGSEVGRATLKLYVGSVRTAGKLDVYTVVGDWDESQITANNAPPLGSLVTTTAQIGLDQKGRFIVIDITVLVRQWLGDDGQGANGIPNHGLALVTHPVDGTTPEVADLTFDSKENSQTSHEPQLNIQLEGTTGGLQKVEHDATLAGDGTSASPLGIASGGVNSVHLATDAVTNGKIADNAVTSPKITAPLSLTSADAGFTLSVENTGAGAALTATGAINTTTQYNIGGQRILSNAGTNNLFAGTNAGAGNTTGNANAFFGKHSGQANTTGSSNSFVGYNAGAGNTTGGNNSFFGDAAGFRNAAGNNNSFFGFLAGFHNTASNNAFFGSLAGADNTTGGLNSFFGNGAGARNTTGGLNSFFGQAAGIANTTGGNNSFFGLNAGVSNTEGGSNSFFGLQAGYGNTTGSRNTFIGWSAGSSNRTGSNNTVVGNFAEVGADNLSFATAIGSGAVVNASDTVVLGRIADTVQVPGALNVAGTFGANVLNAATQFNIGGQRILSVSGTQQFPNSNIFAGVAAGTLNTGSRNSIFGASAGANNTTGSRNSFFGSVAGADNTTGGDNSFFGNTAGIRNTTGCCSSFFGSGAGFHNTTGAGNSFFGFGAGSSHETGNENSFFGAFAGIGNISGERNTFIGNAAGFSTINTTGNDNTLLGDRTTIIAGLSNATAIGARAQVTQSNSLVLGAISGVNAGTNTNVGIGTTAPRTKLHVAGGKVYVEANGQGVILKAPGGACFELTVTDAGALTATAVACP